MITYLSVGDRWNDGHGQYQHIKVDHNLKDNAQLEAAYNRGTSMIGFNFSKEACSGYEEGSLTKLQYDTLKKFIDLSPYIYLDDEEEEAYLDNGAVDFADTWLKIAKLGSPLLVWEFLDLDKNSLDIGGYGLFQ